MSTLDDFKENDLIQSVYDEAKNRMRSIMWWTFVISWCLWNWEAIYTTIFVDQTIIFEQTKLFKIEYILQHYYSWKTWWNVWLNILKLAFWPALSTYIIIYQISKLDLIFFKQNYKNKIAQKNAALDLDKNILAKEERNILEKGKILKKQKKNILQEKQIKEKMTEEEIWKEEYKKLEKKDGFLNTLETLKECMYLHNGDVWKMKSEWNTNLTPQRMAFLESNDLMQKSGNHITLTEKGKFFLKNLFEEEDSKI